mmetsp:Transcript_21158/g.31950  ORF Transcript_21158/g.31950 Transcript_21158/m.31950 type:complete len:761 (-) Transcript_21158:93-2375(-)
MTSITIVDIQDTNPQTENFDTVRSIDVDQEGFIEANLTENLEDATNNENSIDQATNENDMDDVEMSTFVKDSADDSADHGIPSGALIEALHPEQHTQLQDLNEEDKIEALAPPTASANPFSPPPAVGRLSRRTTSHGSSGPVYNDDHYDDNTTNAIDNIGATKRTCLRRKASKEGGRNNSGTTAAYNEVPTSDASVSSSSSHSSRVSGGPAAAMGCGKMRRLCRESSTHLLRKTVSVMNFFARALLYGSVVAMIIGVVWYSRELKLNGTDPHLIAWFSAGAFVLLGFPISMCGIFMHLTNYYQPNVQCYVVRILWMVPIYSIQSWLCLRYINVAIYIETLRDFYESYVLYSFFQFLVEVLQGEEQLTLMLKDKSPTRGVHMWGLQWCVKPWLMGQPVSRRVSFTPDRIKHAATGGVAIGASASSNGETNSRPIKRVEWTSPFFIKCKFGVLQYVLLKFVSAIFVMVLEMYGLYKEGDFTPKGGYLYICILTNLSQCWALYCLIFFYYALKNELGPIRPVGKFLSVKALVFFTWWQSLGISILAMMGLIPHYTAFNTEREWTSEAVAKGMQDWLICIEMFVAAIVHTFVFPHTDYLEPLNLVNQGGGHHLAGAARRVGRRGRFNRRSDDKSACSKNSGGAEPFETLDVESGMVRVSSQDKVKFSTVYESDTESAMSGDVPRHQRQGFVRALIDSTLPRDVLDESGRIFKGEFNVEKKSLLHHAVTSDEYDLFAKSTNRRGAKSRKARSSDTSEEVPNSISL